MGKRWQIRRGSRVMREKLTHCSLREKNEKIREKRLGVYDFGKLVSMIACLVLDFLETERSEFWATSCLNIFDLQVQFSVIKTSEFLLRKAQVLVTILTVPIKYNKFCFSALTPDKYFVRTLSWISCKLKKSSLLLEKFTTQ